MGRNSASFGARRLALDAGRRSSGGGAVLSETLKRGLAARGVDVVPLEPEFGPYWLVSGRRRKAHKAKCETVIITGTPISICAGSSVGMVRVIQNRATLDWRFTTLRRALLGYATRLDRGKSVAIGVAPFLGPRLWIPIGFELTPDWYWCGESNENWIVPGSFANYRDWRPVLEMASASSMRFCFVGRGTDSPSFRALVDAYGAGHNVTGVGNVERDELRLMFQDSQGIILASQVEAYPVTALEAAASGRPVIASDIEGHRLTLGGLPTVRFYRPGSAASLRSRIDADRQVASYSELEDRWYTTDVSVRITPAAMVSAYLDLAEWSAASPRWPWL